jgi:hypothetical protein
MGKGLCDVLPILRWRLSYILRIFKAVPRLRQGTAKLFKCLTVI